MTQDSPSRNGTARPGDGHRVRDLLRVLRRNWVLAVGIPVVVLVATVGFLLMVTPIYQQVTSIRIDQPKPAIPLLDVDVLQGLTGGGSAVETEMQVLRSRVIAEDVVDSLKLQLTVREPGRVPRDRVVAAIDVGRETPAGDYRLERQRDGRFSVEVRYRPESDRDRLLPFGGKVTEPIGSYAAGARIPLRGGSVVLAPGAAGHERIRFRVDKFYDAVDDLRDVTRIARPSREADMVIASYEGPDPVLVRDATNLMAHAFITRRRAVSTSEARSTERFLSDQIRALSGQLAAAEEELRDFREAHRVIAPEVEAEEQMKRLAEMQAERDVLAAEGVALSELLRDIERGGAAADTSAYRRLIAFPTLFRNPAASELLGQLAEVENERARLLNRRTADDVDVVVLTTRVREIERQLHTLSTTYLQGLGEQVASLDGTLRGYRSQLDVIPQRDLVFARLVREVKGLGDIYLTLQGRLKEAEMAVAVEDGSVRVVDPAILPDRPVKPNIPVSLAFALLLGMVLGVGAALARDAMDTTVRTRDDLQEAMGVTVLGSIPRIHDVAGARRRPAIRVGQSQGRLEPRLVSTQDPRGPFAEAYRALRTNITFSVPENRPQTLVFTSSMPGDGKSTTASNLAITLAQQEVDVLLVDADMRRGGLHELFGLEREPGLSELIRGRVAFEDAVQRAALADGRLDFLATGAVPPNPAELLGSARLEALLEEWKARYEMVILDAPPLNVVTDAAILGTRADGVLLVARSGITDRAAVAYALEQLEHVRAPLLGTVLNDLDLRRDGYAGTRAAYAHYYGDEAG